MYILFVFLDQSFFRYWKWYLRISKCLANKVFKNTRSSSFIIARRKIYANMHVFLHLQKLTQWLTFQPWTRYHPYCTNESSSHHHTWSNSQNCTFYPAKQKTKDTDNLAKKVCFLKASKQKSTNTSLWL